ncbi:helix-turn-helix domain-containing protein [Nocardioides sp. NBC_00163]|uniref:sigma-54-dependent Fis family transcriptional regulator n=1 Tax=Nocardioides sp. NBC_00163 TaxID=2975999 RepID=UPI0032459750
MNIGEHGLRPEIETAWHRAQLAGLDPGMEVRESVMSDVDRRSRLVLAAEPVLDRMAQDLSDTRFSVLLADKGSVIVDRRYGMRSLTGALDRVMAVPGSRYVESVSGTNALATAFELRAPISVCGSEHFLEALQQFSCFGAPIVHPATRRLEGVLDVTGHVDDATRLLRPFLMRAVRDIEQHLLEGSRVAEQKMLAAFQIRAANRPNPVVVLSDDVFLANRHAIDLLDAADHARLREMAIDAPRSGTVTSTITLAAGLETAVHFERVQGSPGGVIFDFEPLAPRPPVPRSTSRAKTSPRLTGEIDSGDVVVIHGEPGTGRSTLGLDALGADAKVVSAADEVEVGAARWLLRARRALGSGRPVLFDDTDLLTPAAAGLLGKLLDAQPDATVALVASSDLVAAGHGGTSSQHAALLARASKRREILPLRQRVEEFPNLVASLLADLPSGTGRKLTPTALHILESRSWPGNVRELRRVLKESSSARTTGDITDADLPAAYRTGPRRRHLGLLEQAEHDTIVAVLAEEGGNKTKAAERLGIGRNTLYERIRRLGIQT